MALLRFAWQAWHFVTFRRVWQRVESRFVRHAQYFCDVFRRCVAVFVAGAALCALFCESHCQGCVKWRQGANSVAGVAFCET